MLPPRQSSEVGNTVLDSRFRARKVARVSEAVETAKSSVQTGQVRRPKPRHSALLCYSLHAQYLVIRGTLTNFRGLNSLKVSANN